MKKEKNFLTQQNFKNIEHKKDVFHTSKRETSHTIEYWDTKKQKQTVLEEYKNQIPQLDQLYQSSQPEETLKTKIIKDIKIIDLIAYYLSTKKIIYFETKEAYYKNDKTQLVSIELDSKKYQKKSKTIKIANKVCKFLNNIGIIEDFQKYKFSSLLTGNATGHTAVRKNNTGKENENQIYTLISSEIAKIKPNLKIVLNNDDKIKYPPEVIKKAALKKKRVPDIVIYEGDKPLMFVEVNCYHDSGSKISAITQDYTLLNKACKEAGEKFVWITDGIGWDKQTKDLEDALQNIDNFYSLDMFIKVLPYLLNNQEVTIDWNKEYDIDYVSTLDDFF